MTFAHSFVVHFFKGLTRILCRIDDGELVRVAPRGPLILYTNHVNILEIPIIYTHLQPRPVAGMVAAVRWKNPFYAWLLNVVGAIPLQRHSADIAAVRSAIRRLQAGEIIIISPEGTRSGHGRLQRAHPGVVLLALRSGAALQPVAYHGSERYRDDWRRVRRTDFRISVGRPFHLNPGAERVSRATRAQMLDEMMYQLAALLPPANRGIYADLSAASTNHLSFAS
jgi:1-acyl-sn-glycerol-3-phosphate acyltransferase